MLWAPVTEVSLFQLSWEHTRFSSLSSHLVHLLCSFAPVSVDILVPSVQHCRSDCISFSTSAPQLLRETFALQGFAADFDGRPNPRRNFSFEISCRFCFHADASTSRTSSSSKTMLLFIIFGQKIFPHRPDHRRCPPRHVPPTLSVS